MINESLAQIARNIAERLHRQIPHLQTQLEDLDSRSQEIQTQLRSANLAFKRAESFASLGGGERHCPKCWIETGTQSTMRAINPPFDYDGEPDADIFKCVVCHFETSETSK